MKTERCEHDWVFAEVHVVPENIRKHIDGRVEGYIYKCSKCESRLYATTRR